MKNTASVLWERSFDTSRDPDKLITFCQISESAPYIARRESFFEEDFELSLVHEVTVTEKFHFFFVGCDDNTPSLHAIRGGGQIGSCVDSSATW
ncbi:hypothetical protein CDAR_289861 [Caerostris darwini]|uniref:Uncharacterized protein n=1 Tax=Caerostris darwini TaxID=1538125 RepID=A0AAV4WX87_9ARAC|nr:hypothetical protein CDAR_289861 [Caerostris darwini]